MKHVINITGYLLILAGCSLTAWLTYVILSESYVTVRAGVTSGFALRPRIVITSPVTDVVSQPMIQVIGYFPTEIETITYDITNASGINKSQNNWQNNGYVTSRFLDQAKVDRMTQESFKNRSKPWKPGSRIKRFEPIESAFTTNFFQLYDINLAKGKNRVTIHVRDESGKQYSTRRFYTLDYTSDKTPPVLTLIWPTNNCEVVGDDFELQAKVDDDNATIKTTIKDTQGRIHEGYAIVERNGLVWVKNLPVTPGSNEVTVVATDAAGNPSTNRFNVGRSSVTVNMQPLENDQLNKPLVKVHGTISDASCGVKVNGVEATVHTNGTWEAQKVRVSTSGTAIFNISIVRKPNTQ
jgi:uncharacterized Zn-binding protein involved in type VI secretion